MGSHKHAKFGKLSVSAGEDEDEVQELPSKFLVNASLSISSYSLRCLDLMCLVNIPVLLVRV